MYGYLRLPLRMCAFLIRNLIRSCFLGCRYFCSAERLWATGQRGSCRRGFRVTDVLVTPELAAADHALPVGRAKPGTRIEIHDTDGKSVPEGEKGEIIIIGDTVSTGYYRQEELTKKAFFTVGESRAYHTGDEGYLRDGMLYYCGRIDLQIKLHGYRIELEDIENNIRRLPQISHAVVIPNQRGGKVSSLTAYVVLNEHARKLQEDCGIGLQTAESAVVQEKQFSSPGTGDLQSGAVSEKQSGGGYIPEDEKVMSARHFCLPI